MFKSLIIASLVALSAGSAFAAEPLKLGVEAAYPPFNYIDENGKLTGFDVELGDALCAQIKRDCTWVTQEWSGIIPALEARKFDVIVSSMTITDARKQQLTFTKPYYYTYGLAIAAKGSGLKLTPESLTGKSIGVGAGSTHEIWVESNLGAAVKVTPYKSTDEMFLDFQNGRLDAVFADAVAVRPWVDKNGGTEAFEDVGEVKDPSLGTDIGIAVRKNDTALADELNAALDGIIADGTFKKLNEKYVNFDLR